MKCFFIKSVFLDFSRSLHSVRNDLYRAMSFLALSWVYAKELWENFLVFDTNDTNIPGCHFEPCPEYMQRSCEKSMSWWDFSIVVDSSFRNDIRLNNRLVKGAIRWYRIVLAWIILIVGMLVTWSFRTERREWEKSFCIDTNGTNCCKCSVVISSSALSVCEGAVRNPWVGEISQSMLRISYRNDKSVIFSNRPLKGVEGTFLEI
jgi:hypothetical protein